MGPEIGQGLPIQHGDVVCVRGEGMPIYDPSRKKGSAAAVKKGDLYVQFKVEMPSAEWLATIDPKVRLSPLVDSFCLFRIGVGSVPSRVRSCCHAVLPLAGISKDPQSLSAMSSSQTYPMSQRVDTLSTPRRQRLRLSLDLVLALRLR